MYTEFCPDRLRFAGLIPESLPKKSLQNNAPYVSIRNRIKSAAMAPKQLRVATFQQFSIKLVLKCQKRIS